jgi:hypothetical protein
MIERHPKAKRNGYILIGGILFLLLAALSIPLRAQLNDKLSIYSHWNACVESLKAEGDFETGLWPRLRQSLLDDPPEYVRSLDRQEIVKALIAEHELRLAALKKMLEVERK